MERRDRGAQHGNGDSRIYDLLMGFPLILFCIFALIGFAILMPQQLRTPSPNYPLVLTEAMTAVFLVLQLILVGVRRLPVAKAPGFLPRAWGFLGANFGYAVVLLPRVPLGPVAASLSTLIVVAGTAGSIITLVYLGRAFSILPQARILVTDGPYAYVRHPLYLFEQLATIGVALQYRQPWGLLMFAVSFVIQFPRMLYEEDILGMTFEKYDAYARVTPRLIPFLPAGTSWFT
jgi:protein-S-isoprenylcysteine O-methyltransferase Ste14